MELNHQCCALHGSVHPSRSKKLAVGELELANTSKKRVKTGSKPGQIRYLVTILPLFCIPRLPGALPCRVIELNHQGCVLPGSEHPSPAARSAVAALAPVALGARSAVVGIGVIASNVFSSISYS